MCNHIALTVYGSLCLLSPMVFIVMFIYVLMHGERFNFPLRVQIKYPSVMRPRPVNEHECTFRLINENTVDGCSPQSNKYSGFISCLFPAELQPRSGAALLTSSSGDSTTHWTTKVRNVKDMRSWQLPVQ